MTWAEKMAAVGETTAPSKKKSGDDVTTIYKNLPVDMKEFNQWILIKLIWNEERGKYDKIGYNPNNKKWKAKSNDASTWSTYEKVKEIYDAGNWDGFGYVFTTNDPFIFIDIDNCIEQGQIADWAKAIIDDFKSWTEYSVSGEGLHIICKGKKPGKRCKLPPDFEMYKHSRYIALTGNLYNGYNTILDCKEQTDKLYWRMFGKEEQEETQKEKIASDKSVEDILRVAKNDTKFQHLYQGDWETYYQSQSEADEGLCCKIFFYTGADENLIKEVFNQSALANREKWIKREDYRKRTIDAGISYSDEFFDWKEEPIEENDPVIIEQNSTQTEKKKFWIADHVQSLKDIHNKDIEPIKYVVDVLIPEGVTLISAPAKVGKTSMVMNMALDIVQGGKAFGHFDVFQTDILLGLFEDNNRTVQFKSKRLVQDCPDGIEVLYEDIDFPKGEEAVDAVREYIEENPKTKMIVLDTVHTIKPNFGKGNTTQQDYEFFVPWRKLAQEKRLFVVIIQHNNKRIDVNDPFESISGTAGGVASVENVLVISHDSGKPAQRKLYVRGNYTEEQKYEFEVENMRWYYVGETEIYTLRESEKNVFEAMEYDVEHGTSEISEISGVKLSNINRILNLLSNRGYVENIRKGIWKRIAQK